MKHFWLSYLATIILGGIFLIILLWLIYPVFSRGKLKITSPLPDFLSMTKNKQVSLLDLFLPRIEESSDLKKPQISAKAALVYDLTTKRTLFAKNQDERLPVASLTKIMTAIVALENKKSDDRFIVSQKDLVGENSMGLTAGETFTFSELLYGLMLASGNDAAETLASNYDFGRENFVKAMNDKAKSLGLKNTHFTNPSGLEGDGNQYSTAYEMFVMSNYAISNFPLFQKVVSTFQYTIPYSQAHKAIYLENQTNLLTSYPGVKGIKDGYTPEARLCLVTYLEHEGHKIIGVILGSDDRRGEMKELLDYGLKKLGATPPLHE
ncbi:MAG: D-alanyl-D-alanine carboxypeptidase [Candidatus Levybacteria bacterium]|nr:D-alanyl-D-alanine carboxypeptidase [Candidatus Levybacteria bacterium]